MSVYFQNFDSFLQRLKSLDTDCDKAVRNVVNRMVNEGMDETVKETPKNTGYLLENWKSRPARKQGNGYSGSYSNDVFYGLYVNYGHRLVRNGKTIGYVLGFFMLEAGKEHVSRNYQHWMETEIKNIKQKGGW